MRHQEKNLIQHFHKYNKVLILLGARQVGKTTLLKRIFPKAAYYSVDNEPIRRALETFDIYVYQSLLKNNKYVIIDELHRISDPGRCAKIIFDHNPDCNLLITGSSSFHIRNKTTESLAGRKIVYYLYPLTFAEYLYQQEILSDLSLRHFKKIFSQDLKKIHYHFDCKFYLQKVLIYGLYPDILNMPDDHRFLQNLADSVIFKDILDLKLIEDRALAKKLLKLLAHQIGSLVNISELAVSLRADQRTIKRYIEIFEESFFLFRLKPYSNNKRNEIIKSFKLYFCDTGLRNALINDFSNIETRIDKGQLFENFVIAEYIKCREYLKDTSQFYFWRNKQKSEVDLVIEKNGDLFGFEIKYNKGKPCRAFINQYPDAKCSCITVDSFF